MSTRAPYEGSRRKLVIAIDVGTTFSGVSYCVLNPGVVPVIHGVNRYPGQERVGADAKVPSIIYYDSDGIVRAVGAEAVMDDNVQQAMEHQWRKAEWFKLHLRPKHTKAPSDDILPPLPPNKTVQQVFADFLEYLHRCTREYIQQTHFGGDQIWEDLEGEAVYVLTHPNGWEGAQQTTMREAAIEAGLVPDTTQGRSRIKFVTEGEASLHYCVSSNLASEITKSKKGLIIVDAGGGTIDLSAFSSGDVSNEFKEIAPASCLFQGSIYVSRRAMKFLKAKLHKSKFAEDVDCMADCFDKSAKLSFRDPSQISLIKFGSARDTDISLDIKFGQLKLQGSDVAAFFEPSITAIKDAIQALKAAAHVPVQSILLVGGFAASSWLFTELQTYTHVQGLQLYRPDGHLGKAVADGAVSYLLDHFVSTRVVKTTIVIPIVTSFVVYDQEHQRRRRIGQVTTLADGKEYVCHSCLAIAIKGNTISESSVFRQSVQMQSLDKSQLTTTNSDILFYRGSKSCPEWLDVEPDMYHEMCTVTADTTSVAQRLPRLNRADGQGYYELDFIIEMLFGLTEYEARICWTENGREMRGPATIVYH